jgi:anti-anti-sigma regulatory factor
MGGDPGKVKVEGSLAGPSAEEFSRVAKSLLSNHPTFQIDLADVTFVDHAGVRLLRSLAAAGVTLLGCSPFIQALINGEV